MNVVDFPVSASGAKAYALRYAAIGWHVFPVWGASGGKCRCGHDCKSPGKHPVQHLAPRGQDDATTDAATIIRWYDAMPEAGVAVFLKPSGLMAVDIDPRNGGLMTMENIEAQHGPLVSDVMAFTQGGGEHRLFKQDSDVALPGKLGAGVDVKRNGYIVVEPTFGVSGQYQWEASSNPLDGAIPSPLPDWIRDIASSRQCAAPDTPAEQARFVSPEQVMDLKEALSYVSPDEYLQWINIGQALKAIGATGFGLWDSWSQTSDKYDAPEMGKKWRSFKPGAYSIESIFKLAQDAGWVNPLSKAATDREAELKRLVEEADKTKVYEVKALPAATLERFPVHGLDALCAWIEKTQGLAPSIATQMAAISIASLAASRLYVSEKGDGAHLYQLVAAQTIGEIKPIHNAIMQIIGEAGLRRILREQRFSSPSSLFKTLMRSPATLYLSSDWGALAAFARRQPSGVTEQVMHLVASCWSQKEILLDSPDELGFRGASATTDDMPVIRDPSLSMLALASHAMLNGAFSASEIGRGAVEQFIFHAGEVAISGDPDPEAVPGWLTDHLRSIRRLPQDESINLDLASIFNGNAELLPTQTIVKFAVPPETYYPAIDALAAGNRQARPLVMAARANFRRLATALAVWGGYARPVASEKIMDWCARFIAARLNEALGVLRISGGSDDGKATLYQVTLESITEAGADGVTISRIVEYTYKFKVASNQKREEVISQLIDDGQIIEQRGKSGKGKRFVAAVFLSETAG